MRTGLVIPTLLQLASSLYQGSGNPQLFSLPTIVLADTDDISLHGSFEFGLYLPHILHVFTYGIWNH